MESVIIFIGLALIVIGLLIDSYKSKPPKNFT